MDIHCHAINWWRFFQIKKRKNKHKNKDKTNAMVAFTQRFDKLRYGQTMKMKIAFLFSPIISWRALTNLFKETMNLWCTCVHLNTIKPYDQWNLFHKQWLTLPACKTNQTNTFWLHSNLITFKNDTIWPLKCISLVNFFGFYFKLYANFMRLVNSHN